jgi:methyl-accepting chemotaxis protein
MNASRAGLRARWLSGWFRSLSQSLGRMRVSTRLATGFGILLALTLLVAGTGVYGMKRLQARVDEIVLINNAKLFAAQNMRAAVLEYQSAISSLLLAGDDAGRQEALARIRWNQSQYNDARSSLGELLAEPGTTEREQKTAALVQADADATFPLLDKVVNLAQAGRSDQALAQLRGEIKPLLKKFEDDCNEIVSNEQNLNDQASVSAQQQYVLGRNLVAGFAAGALLLSLLLALVLTHSISRQLGGEPGYTREVARRIADGDLAMHLTVADGDAESLLAAMKHMIDSLSRVVGTIRASADSVSTGASQIAAGNGDLSSRTEAQASNLEQTAASMEQLTSTVRQSADNARKANELVSTASAVATKGGEVVDRVILTMQGIQESSRRISEIINVIDGIAFQTNILALNAAVEAARAGEQGRGFAVVASEVRTLAQRSAQAAREIKALIHDSVDKVEGGSRLVSEAGVTMQEIVAQVRLVASLISEISSASMEQSSGLAQVNDAVMQLDNVTQQNAALVEEGAAAAQSLREQAVNLAAAVATFRLAEDVHSGIASRVAGAEPARQVPQATAPVPRADNRSTAPQIAATRRVPATARHDWSEF